jgi:membrane protein YqaA with SNARE-associated domain
MANWKLMAAFLVKFLARFGIFGVGVAALLDSASIPIPMDLILAGYVWADKGHFWLYCLLASVGSAIGGLVPYGLGRAGGELFLLKHVNRKRFEQLRNHFEKQEFLAMLVPSTLPPPTPWKAFVFASGVFEMRVLPFMLAVFSGRMIRWMLLSVLVIKLGPGAVDLIKQHGLAVAGAVLGLAVVGFLYWWFRKKRSGKLLDN